MTLFTISLFVGFCHAAFGQLDPFPNLVLQELEFKDGTPGASSIYYDSSAWYPANAFKKSNAYWHSGRDSKGNGDGYPFPHMIWYDFRHPILPGRISFRPRKDACGDNNDGYWCGATKWQFIGSNDQTCAENSKWTILCEDLSGKHFERSSSSKYCTVSTGLRKKFRCLGISVLDSSYKQNSEVSVSGVRIWQRVDELDSSQ